MAPKKLFAGVPASPRVWAMLCAAGVCAIGFFVTANFVFTDADDGAVGPIAFDHQITQFFLHSRSPALTGRVMEVSALGSAPVLLVLALLAYSVVLRSKDWLGVLHLSTVLVGAGVWSRVLQGMFDRARPDDLLPFIVVTEGSFPSAHLFGATACYATFAMFYARSPSRLSAKIAVSVFTSALLLLIGMTRIYLGAHHATDVIAGIAAGGAWAFLVAAFFSRWYGKVQSRS